MTRRITESTVCPFCNESVWTIRYKGKFREPDTEYSQTKRGLRQYFHRSCYLNDVEEQRKLRGELR